MELNCIYALFCFEICFYNSNAVELNKNKSPKAGELALMTQSFNSWSPDWLKYPTVLILWTVFHVDATDASNGSSGFMCLPLNSNQLNVTHILVGEYVSHLLTSGAKRALPDQCYTLVSMKHYVHPVNDIRLKPKNHKIICGVCVLCAFFPFDWAGWVNVVHEDTDLKTHLRFLYLTLDWPGGRSHYKEFNTNQRPKGYKKKYCTQIIKHLFLALEHLKCILFTLKSCFSFQL